jgi:phosphodiesterase/alkaline phosphatase D-like protein
MSPAKLTLGPIIGKVTSDSARILAESDAADNVTVLLKRGGSLAASQTLALSAGRIAAFRFQALSPQTDYRVEVTGAGSSESGSFRTLPATPTSLRIGALSCNRKHDGAPWARLRAEMVRARLDLLVHAGDQVYLSKPESGGDAFERALEIRRNQGSDAEILELFRNHYRSLWGGVAEIRWVLANVPNLAIWDDHEIRNDFGTQPEDRDQNSEVHKTARLAWQVYREYQHLLFEDLPAGPPAGLEYHSHAFGGIGIVFLDLRSARTFTPDPPSPPSRPLLGKPQWQRLQSDLAGGLLAQVRVLLVVSPAAPVLFDPGITNLGSLFEGSLRDQWSYAPHHAEQGMLLELLRAWKSQGGREVFVLSGDLHFGVQETAIRKGGVEFRQMITSAINTRWKAATFPAGKLLLWMQRSPGWGFQARHSGFQRSKNFGIVEISAPAGAPPTIQANLIAAE